MGLYPTNERLLVTVGVAYLRLPEMASSQGNPVFIWKDFKEWKPALEAMFPDILTPELEEKVRQLTPPVKYRDDSGLFEQLSGYSLGKIVTRDKIVEFRRLYSHIRVFHACRPRPVDIKNYYKKGLLPSKDLRRDQIKRFWQIFPRGRYPNLTDKVLQDSIAETGTGDQDLCLVIDSRNLVEHTSQYLIYHGGEHLLNLVTRLRIEDKDMDRMRAELRRIGTPTMFEINLPSEYASDPHLEEFIRGMITNWVYYIAHPQRVRDAFDFTFSIMKPLPPEHIYGHFHPRRIKGMKQ